MDARQSSILFDAKRLGLIERLQTETTLDG